jgi:shikimate kinase
MSNPRLKKCCGYHGAEPSIGCINTGLAWHIHRSVTGPYIVCNDINMNYARNMICFDKNKNKRILTLSDGRKVYVFKTAKAAWKKFNELNQVNIDRLTQQAQEVNQLRQKAKEGDMGAAMKLMEY